MVKFSGEIYKIGINPVVDPPDVVLTALFEAAGRSKGPLPVCGKLSGAEFIQTLVKYGGKWRLYINGPMLKDSGLKVGDAAEVEIEFDPRLRDVPMPPAFAKSLKKDKIAAKQFAALSPSRQKEVLRYLGSLKTKESMTRNIDKLIKNLRGDDSEPNHITMWDRSLKRKKRMSGK